MKVELNEEQIDFIETFCYKCINGNEYLGNGIGFGFSNYLLNKQLKEDSDIPNSIIKSIYNSKKDKD